MVGVRFERLAHIGDVLRSLRRIAIWAFRPRGRVDTLRRAADASAASVGRAFASIDPAAAPVCAGVWVYLPWSAALATALAVAFAAALAATLAIKAEHESARHGCSTAELLSVSVIGCTALLEQPHRAVRQVDVLDRGQRERRLLCDERRPAHEHHEDLPEAFALAGVGRVVEHGVLYVQPPLQVDLLDHRRHILRRCDLQGRVLSADQVLRLADREVEVGEDPVVELHGSPGGRPPIDLVDLGQRQRLPRDARRQLWRCIDECPLSGQHDGLNRLQNLGAARARVVRGDLLHRRRLALDLVEQLVRAQRVLQLGQESVGSCRYQDVASKVERFRKLLDERRV